MFNFLQNVQADTKRLKELESVNEALQKEVVKLSKAKEETERLVSKKYTVNSETMAMFLLLLGKL